METNNYPENGSVVIVDDLIEEALPLMNVLSKIDIAYKYFSGKADELPPDDKPIKNVRIVFLDIELEGMQGVTEDKTKLSALAKVLSRIINKKSLPYIIIAWTKHGELVKGLDTYLSEIKPLFILAIDKSECKKDDGSFNIDKISEKLKEKIKDFGVFQFFLIWQNISNASSIELINDIASIFSFDNQWNDNTGSILKMLAKGYAGKHADENIYRYAMLSFNNLFIDIIEKNIIFPTTSINSKEYKIEDIEYKIEDIEGELNRRLHISLESNQKPLPGNIYMYDSDNLPQLISLDKSEMVKDILNNASESDQNNNIKLILLEVSPFCDYAQNKWKRNRLLPGIICPKSLKNSIKKADFIYRTPLFNLEQGLVYLVFNIKYLTSVSLDLLQNKSSDMRIRKELLNDIQTKIAAHFNRLGITSIDD